MSENGSLDIRLWCDRCKGVLDPETAPMICKDCYEQMQDQINRYKNTFYLIKLAGGNEVQLAQKLEAVKNWYNRFIDNKTIFDSDEAITIFMSEFKELDKILEGET